MGKWGGGARVGVVASRVESKTAFALGLPNKVPAVRRVETLG